MKFICSFHTFFIQENPKSRTGIPLLWRILKKGEKALDPVSPPSLHIYTLTSINFNKSKYTYFNKNKNI